MNKEFYTKNEEICWENLIHFNNHIKMFDELMRRPPKKSTDVTAFKEADIYDVELKTRNICLNTYPTIFIEDYKFADMKLHNQFFGFEPIYINFLEDGYVLVFNLNKLKHYPKTTYKDIPSQGKGHVQKDERRYELSKDDARIYKRVGDTYELTQEGW